MEIIEKYTVLLERFLKGSISAKEFERVYLDEFDVDADNVDKKLYDILESLFFDVQAFTDFQELLDSDSDYYINEEQLRKSATQALQDLHDLSVR